MTIGTQIIGNNNKIPWNISSDLKRFKNLTKNSPVIMGRKTYESIISYLGKPLSDRTSIILTSKTGFKANGCIVVNDVDSAIDACCGFDKSFVIGGSDIYGQFIDISNELLISFVLGSYCGDAYFPEIGKDWKLKSSNFVEKGTNDDSPHLFCIFERNLSEIFV